MLGHETEKWIRPETEVITPILRPNTEAICLEPGLLLHEAEVTVTLIDMLNVLPSIESFSKLTGRPDTS